MPYKPGGGYLPQPYDPDNGQYTDEDKASMSKSDMRALNQLRSSHTITVGYEPHFPTQGIHDEEYNKQFVELFRHKFEKPSIPENKCSYLMSSNATHDKSGFLRSIGYSKYSLFELNDDILKNTDFATIKYSRMKQGGYLLGKALTNLKGYLVTTI
ncbi:MAG: hypothetical protein MJ201_01005 [Mycoplasmoidaceae bacterium]|nr:hypothetical protein [Mycoplasmoidaceae bacterium]